MGRKIRVKQIRVRRFIPKPNFHPMALASYYHSEEGRFACQRICETWDKALRDPAVQNELRPFFEAMDTRKILITGFGYTLPFMETFIGNFDALFRERNWRYPEYSITFHGLVMIPPDSDTPSVVDGAKGVRIATRLPPRIQMMSCRPYTWPFADGSLPCVLLMHCLESSLDTQEILKETVRVLRIGGEVFLMVPHTWTLWIAEKKSIYRNQKDFMLQDLRRMLKEAGLTFRGFSVIGAYPLWRTGKPPYYTNTMGKPADWTPRYGCYSFIMNLMFPTFGGLLLVWATKMVTTLLPFEKEEDDIQELVDVEDEWLATKWKQPEKDDPGLLIPFPLDE